MKVRDAVDEVAAQDLRACDEAAEGAEGFAQGADEDVGDDAGVLAEAATGRAEDAREHELHPRSGSRRGPAAMRGEFEEGGAVAVHAEEGFGDQQAAAEATVGPQGVARGGRVEVSVDPDGRSGEAATVDQAGVVGLVRDDEVLRARRGW